VVAWRSTHCPVFTYVHDDGRDADDDDVVAGEVGEDGAHAVHVEQQAHAAPPRLSDEVTRAFLPPYTRG
jgi:hypothetical protein